MTSHTSIPMRSASIASSLTSAMFTERKMFSSSLVSSAAAGRAHPDDRVADARVQRLRTVTARLRQPADHLRRGTRREVGPARVHALGRERDVKAAPRSHAGLLEDRNKPLACRAGVRRGLQHDELPGLQDVAHGGGGL